MITLREITGSMPPGFGAYSPEADPLAPPPPDVEIIEAADDAASSRQMLGAWLAIAIGGAVWAGIGVGIWVILPLKG